jgi:hypothetical protein
VLDGVFALGPFSLLFHAAPCWLLLLLLLLLLRLLLLLLLLLPRLVPGVHPPVQVAQGGHGQEHWQDVPVNLLQHCCRHRAV